MEICDICGQEREEWELHIYPETQKCKDKEKCRKERKTEGDGE